jgi:RNase H-fold protein (predicted Holliday junction resolvase)
LSAGGAVLAIDPGRRKAGYAVLSAAGAVVEAGIEPVEELERRVGELLGRLGIESIAIGGGTNGRAVRRLVERFGVPIFWVNEFETTRAARSLYFEEHPPRGWRRLIPVGLQLPQRPVDDYAAIVIARRFLARGLDAQPPTLEAPPKAR